MKNNLIDSKSLFVKCKCSCQMLECEISDYKDWDTDVNFTIWHRGRNGKKINTLYERFRWCWQILKNGSPWADDIIATNNDARELAKFILQNLPPEESK